MLRVPEQTAIERYSVRVRVVDIDVDDVSGEVVCELTDMDQPLGRAVGNSLEIHEALDTLEGAGPPDLTELVLGAAAYLLALSDLGVDHDEGRRLAEEAVAEGAARELYDRWVRAQGPAGRPLDSLLARDFGAFEDALSTLAERGFVLRSGG